MRCRRCDADAIPLFILKGCLATCRLRISFCLRTQVTLARSLCIFCISNFARHCADAACAPFHPYILRATAFSVSASVKYIVLVRSRERADAFPDKISPPRIINLQSRDFARATGTHEPLYR